MKFYLLILWFYMIRKSGVAEWFARWNRKFWVLFETHTFFSWWYLRSVETTILYPFNRSWCPLFIFVSFLGTEWRWLPISQKYGHNNKIGRNYYLNGEWFHAKNMHFYGGFYTPLESWDSELSLKKKIKSIRPVLPKLWVIKDKVTYFWQKRFWRLWAMKLTF